MSSSCRTAVDALRRYCRTARGGRSQLERAAHLRHPKTVRRHTHMFCGFSLTVGFHSLRPCTSPFQFQREGADTRTAHLSGIPYAVRPSTTSTSATVAPFCLVFALDGLSGCLSFIVPAWRFISLDHGQVVMFSQSLVFFDFQPQPKVSM